MPALTFPADTKASYDALVADLRAVFGPRLHAVTAFGPRLRAVTGRSRTPADSLALVDAVTVADLTACGAHAERWYRSALRMPLIMGREEFRRSLDAFPLEYDDIIAHHVLLFGTDPFEGMAVRREDLRRACETRAKGHLFHLRSGYLEARSRGEDLTRLILASASPLSALLGNIARLRGAPDDSALARASAIAAAAPSAAGTLQRVLSLESEPLLSADEGARLYPEYLAAMEQLVAYVDGWTAS